MIVAAVNVHRRVPCYLVAIWGQKIGKVRVSAEKLVVASGLGCGSSPMMVALFAVCYLWRRQKRQRLLVVAESDV